MNNRMKAFATAARDTEAEVKSLLSSGSVFEKVPQVPPPSAPNLSTPPSSPSLPKFNKKNPIDGHNAFVMDPVGGFGTMKMAIVTGRPWEYHGQRMCLYKKTKDGKLEPWEPKPDLTCSPFGLYRAIYAWWEDTKEIFGNLSNVLDKVRIGLLGGILLGMAFMIIMVASEIGK